MSEDINWHDWFYYDETSPSCLRWKITRHKGRSYRQIATLKDSIAGCQRNLKDLPNQKYWRVKLFSKTRQVHRVIYEMHNGKIANGFVVDHINKNAADNTITNLRIVTQAVNGRNKHRSINNSSGITGTYLRSDVRGNNVYKSARTEWYDLDGNKRSKSFSFKKYGKDAAIKMAVNARQSAIDEMNRLGAGYTERHGKE
jgi:hypothetical protein